MSQSGYTPIQLYRTTTAAAAPTSGNLAAGELAINLTDEKLYFKNAAGTVKTLASAGASTVGGSNTQVQFNSSGTLAGSSSFVFDGTNVGIGTASPSAKLDVAGTLRSTGVATLGTGATTTIATIGDSATTNTRVIQFTRAAAVTDIVNIQGVNAGVGAANISMQVSGGNVGIGTVTPGEKLSIISTDIYQLSFKNASASSLGAIGYNSTDNMLFNANGAERMRIDSSGNVGIGTSSPDIFGRFYTRTVGINSSGTTMLQINGTTYGGIDFGFNGTRTGTILAETAGFFLQTVGAVPMIFTTNGTERFRISSTGGITSSDLADAVGYKGLPQNSQTSTYTLALADMGKMINTTTGGVVIPANASVAFPIGSAISIFNNSGSNQTISITSDTLRQAGTANTGSRTLAQYGLATCVKVAATTWAISGAGVT